MVKNNNSAGNALKQFWSKHPVISNFILMLVVIPIVCLLLLLFVDVWTHHGQTSVVPDVKGLGYETALEVLREADLDVVVSDSVDNPGNLKGGTIVEVIPKPGSVVKQGREVYLTIVAYNAHQVTITEPLANRDLKSVMNYLSNLGIDTSGITVKRVPWLYPGSVVAVHTGNRTLDVGSRVAVNARITVEYGVSDDMIDAYDNNFEATDTIYTESSEPDNVVPAIPENVTPEQPSQTNPQPVNPLYD